MGYIENNKNAITQLLHNKVNKVGKNKPGRLIPLLSQTNELSPHPEGGNLKVSCLKLLTLVLE